MATCDLDTRVKFSEILAHELMRIPGFSSSRRNEEELNWFPWKPLPELKVRGGATQELSECADRINRILGQHVNVAYATASSRHTNTGLPLYRLRREIPQMLDSLPADEALQLKAYVVSTIHMLPLKRDSELFSLGPDALLEKANKKSVAASVLLSYEYPKSFFVYNAKISAALGFLWFKNFQKLNLDDFPYPLLRSSSVSTSKGYFMDFVKDTAAKFGYERSDMHREWYRSDYCDLILHVADDLDADPVLVEMGLETLFARYCRSFNEDFEQRHREALNSMFIEVRGRTFAELSEIPFDPQRYWTDNPPPVANSCPDNHNFAEHIENLRLCLDQYTLRFASAVRDQLKVLQGTDPDAVGAWEEKLFRWIRVMAEGMLAMSNQHCCSPYALAKAARIFEEETPQFSYISERARNLHLSVTRDRLGVAAVFPEILEELKTWAKINFSELSQKVSARLPEPRDLDEAHLVYLLNHGYYAEAYEGHADKAIGYFHLFVLGAEKAGWINIRQQVLKEVFSLEGTGKSPVGDKEMADLAEADNVLSNILTRCR